MIKAGIIGATGYTGIELLRLLLLHPQVEITMVTSEKLAGKRLDELFPQMKGRTDLVLQPLNDDKIAKACTLAFSCLPHKEAMSHIPKWLKKGTKVVDLSADFRFHSAAVYKEWYSVHEAPELLKEAVYGLPELHREDIRKTFLVGNPGCYTTCSILGLAPLVKNKLISFDSIVIDAKSGVSGAGRSAALETLFAEVNESIHAYKVGNHRHTPEIEQELSLLAGEKIVVSFTPHLIPMDRGILATIHTRSLRKTDTKTVREAYQEFYQGEPFIKVLPEGKLPRTKDVRGSNDCQIGVVFDPRTNQIVTVSAIDNLMKGASSQAVQNMNLMYGLAETTGINNLPWVP